MPDEVNAARSCNGTCLSYRVRCDRYLAIRRSREARNEAYPRRYLSERRSLEGDEFALPSINFRIAPLSPARVLFARAHGIQSGRSDARGRFASPEKTKPGETFAGRIKEKKKKKSKEKSGKSKERVKERIEKSSASVGSHISFEAGKPTSGVLTSPSGTTFRKIILLEVKAIPID